MSKREKLEIRKWELENVGASGQHHWRRRLAPTIPALFSVFCFLSSPAQADWRMFRKDTFRAGFSTETGELDSIGLRWKYTITPPAGIAFSSPAIGDINGDGKLEIVIGADNYNIYVLQDTVIKVGSPPDSVDSAEAKLLWTYPTGGCIRSSPLLIDLNGDGVLDIVFGSYDDSVHAIDGFGNPLWSFGTDNWVFSSPVGGDIDLDGMIEIVVGSNDSCLYVLWGFDGTPKWKYKTGGIIESSPALGDINGDDTLEVVVGSYDNKLYAFHNGDTLWTYTAGGGIYSTPAIGDLDNDGDLDVVFGCYDGYVYALDGPTGNTLWAPFYTGGWIGYASPALADIDNDDTLEIIIGSGGGERLYCIEGQNGNLKWNVNPTKPETWMIEVSCAISDINSDGALEIVLGTHDSFCRSLKSNGDEKWEYELGGDPHSGPALGDIDGDGKIEVVVATLSGEVFVLDWPARPIGIEENEKLQNTSYKLQVYPNPFTRETVIQYEKNLPTPYSLLLTISIYDLAGRLVRTLPISNSQFPVTSIVWDGRNNEGKRVSSGIYFCRIEGEEVQIEHTATKLIYIR